LGHVRRILRTKIALFRERIPAQIARKIPLQGSTRWAAPASAARQTLRWLGSRAKLRVMFYRLKKYHDFGLFSASL